MGKNVFKKVFFLVLITAVMLCASIPAYAAVYSASSYTELASLAASTTTGDTIDITGNITLEGNIDFGTRGVGLHIPEGYSVVLDLNGYTISQAYNQTGGYQLILNDGALTITDSVGGGAIVYKDTGSGGEYISDVIYNRANLVISGGTIHNTSSTTVASNGYPHAVDTYSGIRNTTCVIYGGTIRCDNYSAIRMFCVSPTNTADLTINGGTIQGAVDMQNGSVAAAAGSLTINGGTFQTTANPSNLRFANWNGGATTYGLTASVTGGSFDGGIATTYVPENSGFDQNFITGGTFTQDVSQYLENGYVLENGKAVLKVTNPYKVPSTGDNSEVALWSVLFVGFAVLALVSRRKRKA